ncbi:MAG TPA: DUF3429 domain-containing protein [Sphingomonas sp.]
MTDGPMDASRPRVSRAAWLLGLSGLLPQIAAVLAILTARLSPSGPAVHAAQFAIAIGIAYPLLILSFLGGVWWGFAVRRTRGQGALAVVAVAPSLIALALLALGASTGHVGFTLVAIGCAILLTLVVDRALARGGDAPADWMRLRVPLSAGLGGLTILLGALVGGPVTHL